MSITERKLKNGKVVYDNAFMYKGTRYKKGGFKTKGQAENWEIEVKYDVNKNGSYFEPCKKTFAIVWNEYYELEKDRYAPATCRAYEQVIRSMKKEKIYKTWIININYNMIQEFFNKIGKEKNRYTCNHYKIVFNLVFKHAIRCGYIKNNPMPYIIVKGNKTNNDQDKKTITWNEFILISNYFINDQFDLRSIYIALQIGWYTGARISEILALEKNDIDFNNHTISFNKKLENRVNKPYIGKMKTQTSYAIVPLAEPLENILLDWFDENPYDIICVRKDGRYIKHGYINEKISELNKHIPFRFHFHMLRHTYASNLVMHGVNPTVAQKLLRLPDVQTTLNIYTHSNIDIERMAINSVFNNKDNVNYPKITPNKQIN